MAIATTSSFDQLVLETSDDGTTWTRICGIIDVSIKRTAALDTAEVPDCDDESLPLSIEKSVRSIDYSVTGTGVWAQESHGTMQTWFRSAARRRVRIGWLNAASTQIEYESGYAFLTDLSNERTKGKKVSASIELQFDGTPTAILKT